MKYLFTFLIAFSSITTLMAQDTTNIFINNVKAAEAIIKADETTATLVIKKPIVKNIKSIYIQVSGEHVGGPYKRTLQIGEDNFISAAETKNKPGHFNLTKTDIKKQLAAGKSFPVYLLLDPANPMMLRPSKRIFVGTIIIN